MARTNGKSSHERGHRKQCITNILAGIDASWAVEANKPKATLADYIRLTQLERELEQEEDQPQEIVITWADPRPTRNTGK